MARILVIDDEEPVRRVARATLERAGHEVFAGLKRLATTTVDLVITDIFMPGQDGIVTVRRIRKELPHVKVIVVSGGDFYRINGLATGRRAVRCRGNTEEAI